MVYITGKIANDIFIDDKIIKKTLESIVSKEKKIINDYKNLQYLKANLSDNHTEELDKLLDERKLYLTFKIQSKEQQLSSLIKLLEYINMLEDKNKQLENDKLYLKWNN